MQEQQLLMIKYGELGLKGKNKNQFINRLVKNIERAISDLPERKVSVSLGRITVPVLDDRDAVVERLSRVFGIYAICPVRAAAKSLPAIQQAALATLNEALPDGGEFKVESRRSDKRFPMTSPEISKAVGGYIFAQTGDQYTAQMRKPQHIVNVEVRDEAAYVYCGSFPGAKGMPVGTGGRAVVMLSGGIDSPVAAFMAMKRGVNIEAVHFESFPFTSERALEKVLDLAQVLARWHNKPLRVHAVHFTEIQKAIHAACPEEYGITIMRRFMFRLAEQIARRNAAIAIYTGESVGQVASQTLESMYVINNVTKMPVLRPLIGFDKEEIVARAKQIGTFDISIRPYEDCCTVFLPPHPKIKPRLSEAEAMEQNLAVEELIAGAIERTKTYIVTPSGVTEQADEPAEDI